MKRGKRAFIPGLFYAVGVGFWLFIFAPLAQDMTVNTILILAGFICFIGWAVLSILWPTRMLVILVKSTVVFLWGGLMMGPLLGRVGALVLPRTEYLCMMRVFDIWMLATAALVAVTLWRVRKSRAVAET